MIKKTVKKVNCEVVEDILCNKCGESLIVKRYKIDNPVRVDHGEENYVSTGISQIKAYGQYYSKHLEDGKVFSFSLCEKCVKDLMDQFVIPPDTTEELL